MQGANEAVVAAAMGEYEHAVHGHALEPGTPFPLAMSTMFNLRQQGHADHEPRTPSRLARAGNGSTSSDENSRLASRKSGRSRGG